MFQYRLFVWAVCLLLLPVSAASQSLQSSLNTVVASIADEPITLEEVVQHYQQNNIDQSYTRTDIEEFLPYYINFRLKLTYGKGQGYGHQDEISEELQEYTMQAALAKWRDNVVEDFLLDQFIERRSEERRAFHLLIALDAQSHPMESLNARNRLIEARSKFLSGTPIDQLDREYSTFRGHRSMGGQLPWVTAGVTIKPFEDVLYSLQPGEISMPVRTQFGYHLILLQDVKEAQPARKISHIYFQGAIPEDGEHPVAAEAYTFLESGVEWDDVVRQFTNDTQTKETGGDIGWIGRTSQFNGDFVDSVLSLDVDAPFSEPIQSSYGVHIFRVDSVRTYHNERHRFEDLKKQYEDLPGSRASQRDVLNFVAREAHLSINENVKTEIADFAITVRDQNISQSVLPQSVSVQTLISSNNKNYTAGDFWSWIGSRYADATVGQMSTDWIMEYRDHIVRDIMIDETRARFDDFDDQIRQFRDGLIVYNVTDQEVWNAETADSTQLRAFFNDHRERYQFDERYSYTLLASRQDSIVLEGIRAYEQGLSDDELRELIPQLSIVRDETANILSNPYHILTTLSEGEISEPFTYRNRSAVFILNEVLPPRPMTFEEAFHRVATDFQPIREEQFMEQLRNTYNLRIYSERIQ
ncbi:MAG: peptidylprolyl isomerase [Balneolaceae bacterium]